MSAAEGLRNDELLELEDGAERERQIVELIRADYDATFQALTGFVGAGSQIRSIGIAGWGVVLGLALQDKSALLAAVAFVLVALFAYADAYHAALYRRALSRAISLESLLDAYLERLGIDAEDADAILRTRAKLETHRFGMHRTLRPLKAKDILAARPKAIFWAIYPTIAAVTILFIIAQTI